MMSATEEYESSLLFGQKVVPSSSLYAGVSWHKVSKRWAVQIRHDGKRHHVGYFDSEESAARAYDEVSMRCDLTPPHPFWSPAPYIPCSTRQHCANCYPPPLFQYIPPSLPRLPSVSVALELRQTFPSP